MLQKKINIHNKNFLLNQKNSKKNTFNISLKLELNKFNFFIKPWISANITPLKYIYLDLTELHDSSINVYFTHSYNHIINYNFNKHCLWEDYNSDTVVKSKTFGAIIKYMRSFAFSAVSFRFFRLYKYLCFFIKYLIHSIYKQNNVYFFINKIINPSLMNSESTLNVVNKYRYLFNNSGREPYYIYNLILNALRFRNLDFIILWIRRLFSSVNFFKHQFLLFYLRYFFKTLEEQYDLNLQVNGLFLKFHGKIAKGGNSRRKKFLIKYKTISTSHRSLYIVEKFQLNSHTGVVGCTLILSYPTI